MLSLDARGPTAGCADPSGRLTGRARDKGNTLARRAYDMPAPQEYRDRDEVEVAILDALIARQEDGMTVFELRSRVDADIETLESALSDLHDDGLIVVEHAEHRSVIMPAERVVPDPDEDSAGGVVFDRLREHVRIIRRIVRRR